MSAGWKRSAPSARFVRLEHLRRLRDCEKVAAVCYRVGRDGIEFLLVQTRGKRWTFPKGSAEPGLTHAQAAALEAFEEAGVHGRMEEAAFTRYLRRSGGNSSAAEMAVNVHLCEVTWLEAPQEFNRNPSWFSAEETKRRLRDGRKPDYGAELARVVDRALARIRRVRPRTEGVVVRQVTVRQKDSLEKVTVIDYGRRITRKASR
jgi:8-oxo-dGTP pyrophosphatase MutT (NUDIX family)